MLVSDIDFETLESCTDPSRWGAGGPRDRHIYRNTELYFKVWGKRFLQSTMAAVGNEFVRIEGLSSLHGFEVGLYNPTITGAFVDWIFDGEGSLRGYITHRGDCPQNIPDEFVDRVLDASYKCGWTYSDLKCSNVISVNGVYSLIDFDTHLVSLEQLDIEFEKNHGCLRPHVSPRFTSAILSHVQGRYCR